MAVYERGYRPYGGQLTPERTRFLVLPRYAYRQVFRSRVFGAFLLGCLLWPFVVAVIIYLPHNLRFLQAIQEQSGGILSIFRYDETFFYRWLMIPHGFMAFVLAFVVGPALISADLRNNGLALYLSRPFSRAEYILGKTTVLIVLLSAITWIPGLLLFCFQAYLGGSAWLGDHWRIGPAIFLAFWIWILTLCLFSLALSAYVKWKPVAQIALLAVFFVLPLLAAILNLVLDTRWASLINVGDMIRRVWAGLFGIDSSVEVPIAAAWLSLVLACGACLTLLARKVRAYEVVKS
jgi:ABC-2 type transport system permease protein